jgi:hypothetical protein
MSKTLKRAGQVNLKGKKSALMRCGCCVCRRPEIIEKMVKKKIREATYDLRERVAILEGHDNY